MTIEGLPREWHRGPQWASPRARDEWEPIIRAAAAAWTELEIVSVSAGLRPSALLHLTPAELVQATRDAAGQDLDVTPLAWDGTSTRIALHPRGLRARWLEAWSLGADNAIGELLGFPPCCREYFSRTWALGRSDTVTAMAAIAGPPQANVLHRDLGVRLVPHLPCSGTCEASVELGNGMLGVAHRSGIDPSSILRVLSLPVKYSALHGVAILETPHWRVMRGTDWTAVEVTENVPKTCTASSCCGDGHVCGHPVIPEHHHDAPAPTEPEPSSWSDNGFATHGAMEAAHAVIAAVVGHSPGRVVDLGCGDGALLARLTLDGLGIEQDAAKCGRGVRRHADLVFVNGSIEDWFSGRNRIPAYDSRFDVALMMPGRLLEMSPKDASAVRGQLMLQRRVVLYAYGDVLARHGGLGALCAAAGLPPIGAVKIGSGVQAAEVLRG